MDRLYEKEGLSSVLRAGAELSFGQQEESAPLSPTARMQKEMKEQGRHGYIQPAPVAEIVREAEEQIEFIVRNASDTGDLHQVVRYIITRAIERATAAKKSSDYTLQECYGRLLVAGGLVGLTNEDACKSLAALVAERDALKIEYESRAIWIRQMNDILGYNNDDGFHSEPDPFTIAKSLRQRIEQLEKENQELRGGR